MGAPSDPDRRSTQLVDELRFWILLLFLAFALGWMTLKSGRSAFEALGLSLTVVGLGRGLWGIQDGMGRLVGGLWTGWSRPDPRELDRLNRWEAVRGLAKAGASAEQAQALEGIVGSGLGWVRPNFELAEVCGRDLGDYDRALSALRRAAEPPPGTEMDAEEQTLSAQAKRRLAEWLGPDGRLRPALAPQIVEEARADLERGQVEVAVRRLETATRLDPANAEIDRLMGGAFKSLGRYREAVQHLLRAAQKDPRGTEPLRMAAEIYEEDENAEGEAACWRELLARAGSSGDPALVERGRRRLAELDPLLRPQAPPGLRRAASEGGA